MSKLITREAFKISLKAIKDYIEKKLKSVLSETKIIAEDVIKSTSKEFATKSELDSKLDLDNNAQNDHVAIFKLTDTGVNLLDSGCIIGTDDLGEVKRAWEIIGTGAYGSSVYGKLYGYIDTSDYTSGPPSENNTIVYQDQNLTIPIGRMAYGAPIVLIYFNSVGDITSGLNTSGAMPAIMIGDCLIIGRVIKYNTIATELGVLEYTTNEIIPKINQIEDNILKTIHVSENSSSITVEENTRVVLDTPVSNSITFNFNLSEKEIVIIFTAGENCNCVFNQELNWLNDNAPTWEAGKTYEISIFNNLAVYTSYVV